MLRILHTADWHLGQNFFGYDRTPEHLHFLNWLYDTVVEKEVDVCLLAGDIFDVSNPSAASQRMFYDFVQTVTAALPGLQLVVIAGNHDSPARLEAPVPLLRSMNVEIKGVVNKIEGEVDDSHLIVPLKTRSGTVEGYCVAIPYLRQGDYPAVSAETGNPYAEGVKALLNRLTGKVRERLLPGQCAVAMAHMYVAGSEIVEKEHSERIIIGGLESVSGAIFDDLFSYVALGHIHKPQRIKGEERIRYAGSPLPMSFAEKGYRHGVDFITLHNGAMSSCERLLYRPLTGLLSVPEKPLPLPEVISLLRELPVGSKNADSRNFPYLEVKVELLEPEPDIRRQIEEAIAGKAVRLARIVSAYRTRETQEELLSIEGLQALSPLEIAAKAFENRFDHTMPPELMELLEEVWAGLDLNQE